MVISDLPKTIEKDTNQTNEEFIITQDESRSVQCRVCGSTQDLSIYAFTQVTGLLLIYSRSENNYHALCNKHKGFRRGWFEIAWCLFLGWGAFPAFLWNITALISNMSGGKQFPIEMASRVTIFTKIEIKKWVMILGSTFGLMFGVALVAGFYSLIGNLSGSIILAIIGGIYFAFFFTFVFMTMDNM